MIYVPDSDDRWLLRAVAIDVILDTAALTHAGPSIDLEVECDLPRRLAVLGEIAYPGGLNFHRHISPMCAEVLHRTAAELAARMRLTAKEADEDKARLLEVAERCDRAVAVLQAAVVTDEGAA